MVESQYITVEEKHGRIGSSGISHINAESVSGADLTQFEDGDFQVLIDHFGLEHYPIKTHNGDSMAYLWVSDELLIITGANPLTGEQYRLGRTINQGTGYASYMGFEGESDAVSEALQFVKDNAFTDGYISETDRDFI